jgi:CheY-like chemotaxis protein
VADTKGNRGKHILVVNDTEEIIELFREIIEGMGHRMTALSFAPDDLSQITKVEPDLVILDLVFNTSTEGQGWQLLQKLRMTKETETLPVILCSAATDQVREQEGWLMAKGVKVVLKPFTVDDLELAIEKGMRMPETAV